MSQTGAKIANLTIVSFFGIVQFVWHLKLTQSHFFHVGCEVRLLPKNELHRLFNVHRRPDYNAPSRVN
jgi:hypothetical protein